MLVIFRWHACWSSPLVSHAWRHLFSKIADLRSVSELAHHDLQDHCSGAKLLSPDENDIIVEGWWNIYKDIATPFVVASSP